MAMASDQDVARAQRLGVLSLRVLKMRNTESWQTKEKQTIEKASAWRQPHMHRDAHRCTQDGAVRHRRARETASARSAQRPPEGMSREREREQGQEQEQEQERTRVR